MSLVNKMLRDLDARHAGDRDRATLPAAVTPLAAHREPGRGTSRLWLVMLLAIAVLGFAAWHLAQPDKVAAPATVAVAAAPVAPPVPVLPAAPAAPVAAAAPLAPAVPGAPAPVEAAGAPPPAPPSSGPSLRMANQLAAASVAGPSPKAATAATNTPQRPLAGDAASRAPSILPPVPLDGRIDKQVRLPTSTERAESEYRRGVLAHRQGNLEQAAAAYRAALGDYPEHAAARQTLAALLIDAKRFDDAEELLRQGTELAGVRLASTLALARLKVERNQASAALDLLQRNAASGERSADYQGFLGALLNRANRSAEAVERYQAATQLAPTEGRWWAGLGMALDAAGKAPEAREAYQKARGLPGLPADLAQHIDQRLR